MQRPSNHARRLTPITAIDDAVPARAIAPLRAQIIAFQARRPMPGDGGTHWYLLESPARLLVEQVIQHLRTIVPGGQQFVGAEWWVRATATDTGFPFHFDRDEGIRSSIVSPDLASILYLSNVGGPTVILDAAPSRASAPTTGVAVHPRSGRFAMFPGTLLHGVLPGRPSGWPRVTMLVNWWRTVPQMECTPAPRRSTRALRRWPVDVRANRPVVPLEALDPTTLLSKAAWRDIIAGQTTYR